jgi:hypothetical protein
VLVDRGAAGGAGDRGEEGERMERRKSGSDLGRPRSSRVRAEAEPSREGVADTRAGNESIDYLLGGGGLRASGGLPAAAPRGGCFASEGGDESWGQTTTRDLERKALERRGKSLPDGPCNGLHPS